MRRTTLALVGVLALLSGLAASAGHAEQTSEAKRVAADELRVNLNTSSAAELAQLPGIGEKVATRVVEYRRKNGRFQKIEEIMNVNGIGEKTFARLRPHLFVEAEAETKKK